MMIKKVKGVRVLMGMSLILRNSNMERLLGESENRA